MKRFGAALIAGAIVVSASASAQERRELEETWRGSARQALEQLGRALDRLEGMVERLPSYGMPYFDRDGDIVIPRREGSPPPRRGPGDPEIVEI